MVLFMLAVVAGLPLWGVMVVVVGRQALLEHKSSLMVLQTKAVAAVALEASAVMAVQVL
jgi:hypothetical protein